MVNLARLEIHSTWPSSSEPVLVKVESDDSNGMHTIFDPVHLGVDETLNLRGFTQTVLLRVEEFFGHRRIRVAISQPDGRFPVDQRFRLIPAGKSQKVIIEVES